MRRGWSQLRTQGSSGRQACQQPRRGDGTDIGESRVCGSTVLHAYLKIVSTIL